VVSSSQVLETVILKNTPKNVFFTPVKWLDPINVRRKRDNQVKDYMLSSPLYFDVDYDWSIGKGLEEAKEMTKTLIFILEAESGRKPDWIVFSGRRGFHIYYWDWDDILCNSSSADSRIISFRKSRETILSKLQNKGVIVDRLVTSDPWRVMRVPGTLHGETGLIAKMFTDIEDFSIEKTRP
jgi:DNA primase catalytic subunit